MNFLFPFTLLFGLLTPAIIAFYLRRPRRRQIEVSTLQFWQKILDQAPRHRFLGRLRNPLSLLLQLLIFLLLLLALARPEWGRDRNGQSSVIVIDARARMQAGGVFRAAINAARGLVSQAGPGNEIAVLTTEGSPQIISPFSTDGRDLRERLAALSASDAGGSAGDTLALASKLLEGRTGTKKRIFITDRADSGAEGFEQILVGQPQENAAILALAQRPVPASPQSAEIFVKLGNFAPTSRDIELELALDGRPFDLRKFLVAPGGERDFSLIVPEEMLGAAKEGLLTARLTGNDSLGADNTARAAIGAGKKLRVLLITESNPFLESALKADPNFETEILAPSAWQPGTNSGFDAVIFDKWIPDGAKPEDFSSGNFFFFGRSPFDTGEEVESAGFEVTEPQSPLFWNVDAATVRPEKIRKMRAPGGWRVFTPLESAGDPIVLALERPGQSRITATAFSVDSSTFPLRVGFPLFVSNTLHWLAGRDPAGSTSFQAGQTFLPDAGQKIASRPRAETAAPPAMQESALRLIKNGFYEVRDSADASPRWISVNTADRVESDLRTATANRNTLLLRGSMLGFQPWQWLALAAFALIVAEWFLHHRRLTE